MKYLLVPAGAVFIAMLPLPIDAYHLIRWIVAATCAYATYEIFQRKNPNKSIGVLLAVIALIYNPLFPFYLSRGLWLIVDAVVVGFLIWESLRKKFETIESSDVNENQTVDGNDILSKASERLKQVEKKGDGFAKQTLVTSIALLVVAVIVTFIFKR